MDHKAEGRVKWRGQLALKCRNYSKSWREDSLQPGGSYTGIVWLEAWHKALSLLQLSTPSRRVSGAFVLCFLRSCRHGK